MKVKGRLYYILFGFTAAALIAILSGPIRRAYPEMDSWWFIPAMQHHFSSMTAFQTLKFILPPLPLMYGIPCFKVFPLLVLSVLGPFTSSFITVSMLVFFLSSVLLVTVSRRLGLDLRISLLCGAVFLGSYMHFNAFLWPIALQHLLITFFILLILDLYLKTESLARYGRNYKKLYIITLAANLLAIFLCRVNVIMAPVIILAHMLFSSESSAACLKKYKRWIPLFTAYLFYPVITLVLVGEHKMGLPPVFMSLNPGLFILFGIGAACITGLWAILRMSQDRHLNVVRYSFLCGLVLLMFLVRGGKDIVKLAALPYAVPFAFSGTLGVFLAPLRSVLESNSSLFYYAIHLDSSFFMFVAGLALLAVFIKLFRNKKEVLAVFTVWYILVLFRTCFNNPVDSRYFIYFTPVFAFIFSTASVRLYDLFSERWSIPNFAKEVLLTVVVAGLLFTNISAIKLRIWRDRFVNTYLIYDYIRTANLIKQDTAATEFDAGDIYINGVTPIPGRQWWHFIPFGPDNYYNFRLVMADAFKRRDMTGVNVNKGLGRRMFNIKGSDIYAGDSRRINRFSELLERGKSYIGKDDRKAEELLLDAAQKKPFLLNYLLPGRPDIYDIKWLCGDNDLRTWVRKAGYRYIHQADSGPDDLKLREVRSLVNKEIDEYIECLFLLSYLHHVFGDPEASEERFYQMALFKSDYERLSKQLADLPVVESNPRIMDFLKGFTPYMWSANANRDRSGFLKFEKFLAKLIIKG